MIERQTIGRRAASVAYLTAEFLPATKDNFAVAKVLFDDGEVIVVSSKPVDVQ